MTDISEAGAAHPDAGNSEAMVFEIGLAMSGAVSAGAYTAGVFDFLIEALDQWEANRGAGPAGRVMIKTMVGASAGAITAGIGTLALAGAERREDGRYTLGRLYDAWVVKPTLIATADGPGLLDLDDLADGVTPAGSVLNARRLAEIAAAALNVQGPKVSRPFVSATLHIYMTLVDLRGTPYTIDFKGSDGYHMLSHASRAHFCVANLGTGTTVSPFADTGDGAVNLSAAALFGAPQPAEWTNFATAALGSAAFPIGLAPRSIASVYGPIKFPTAEGGAPQPVDTAFDSGQFKPGQSFSYVAVDGGVVNNDPFEYARFTLMRDPPHPNNRDAKTADRAVVMIAPFPEAPALLDEGKPPITIPGIAAAVLTSLRQQVRFKPDQLLALRDESVFSRFMISPKRIEPGTKRKTPYAIASGLLGGFGGFVSRPFRDHDYQLGRRNCQQFLRSSFVLPADRPYFDGWSGPARDAALAPASDEAEQPMLPVIPLFGSAAADVRLLDWPRLSMKDFDTLIAGIEARYVAVAKNLVATGKLTVRVAALWRIGLMIGKDRITTFLRYYILSDLILRDQVEGFDLPSSLIAQVELPPGLRQALMVSADDAGTAAFVRAVLAALANPSYDYRTAIGIARSMNTKQANDLQPVVLRVLDLLSTVAGPSQIAAWKASWTRKGDNAGVYTLARRKPNVITDFAQGLMPSGFLFAPTID